MWKQCDSSKNVVCADTHHTDKYIVIYDGVASCLYTLITCNFATTTVYFLTSSNTLTFLAFKVQTLGTAAHYPVAMQLFVQSKHSVREQDYIYADNLTTQFVSEYYLTSVASGASLSLSLTMARLCKLLFPSTLTLSSSLRSTVDPLPLGASSCVLGVLCNSMIKKQLTLMGPD